MFRSRLDLLGFLVNGAGPRHTFNLILRITKSLIIKTLLIERSASSRLGGKGFNPRRDATHVTGCLGEPPARPPYLNGSRDLPGIGSTVQRTMPFT